MVSASVIDPEIIITNLHRRYTGVSGTINALLPVQSRQLRIGFVGTDLPGAKIAETTNPNNFVRLSLWQAIRLSRKKLANGRKRIWHVRRDPEMIITTFLRDVLRFPIRVVFTSAAKHRHSWFPRWLISRMDAVIATTPEAASFVPNTTKVVFHGASIDRFSPPEDKGLIWQQSGLPGRYGIGTFGRIRPSKGTDIFVDAMLKVLPDFPDFTAIICGLCQPSEQGYKQAMLDKIASSGQSKRLIFLGDLPLEDIPTWYRNVTIMVACPRYEPFGITPLEAMASGCAVIASRTGAFEHIVKEGETGLLVPTNNIDALANALRELMSNPDKAIAMGKQGRDWVTVNFSIEKEADRIHAVYQLTNR